MLRQRFEYLVPEDVRQAAAAGPADGTRYMAGGTDLIPLMQYGLLDPARIVAVGRLPELREIRQAGEDLHIGAAVPLHTLAGKDRRPWTGLARAAAAVASPQIRRVGTVAGNLLQERRCMYYNQEAHWRQGIAPCYKTGGSVCHQAPAAAECRALYYSDLAPVLLGLGAELLTAEGSIPLGEICGDTSRLGGRLVTGIRIPDRRGIRYTGFAKQAVRGAIDFALCNAGVALRADGSVRLVMGAMNPAPVLLQETAALLEEAIAEGRGFGPGIYQAATEEARRLMRPVRESGGSPKGKMLAIGAVRAAVRDLEAYLSVGSTQDI